MPIQFETITNGPFQENCYLVWDDEDDDWAERDSIHLVSRAELGTVMAEQDVLFNF